MKVCLGGTFDPLHRGHRLLLEKAVEVAVGDLLFVGLTGDDFASGTRNEQSIRDYNERYRGVSRYLQEKGAAHEIVPIDTRYGIADTDPDLEAIVVSKETYPFALEINDVREGRGLGRLYIFTVNLVRNEFGIVIRGTLIRSGKMDAEGRERGA